MFATNNTPAVFAEESEVVTESVLMVRPSAERAKPMEPVVDQSQMGSAHFDANDALNEESTFASALFTRSRNRKKPTRPRPKKVQHRSSRNTRFITETDSEELDLSEFSDNDPMDFNLGPYPGGKGKEASINSGNQNENLFSGSTSSAPSENAIANKELETYDFDVDFEKPVVSAIPAKAP